MTALLYVRAVVADPADRAAFDEWYATDHSPMGYRLFKPKRFWRCWSHLDPSVHYAFYEFENAERYDEIVGTPEFEAMVADFTRTWGDRVERDRDVISVVHQYPES